MSTPRVFVACLLSLAILTTPIAAIAAPKSISTRSNSRKISEGANSSATGARESSLKLAPPVPEPAPAPAQPFAAVLTATMTDSRPGWLNKLIQFNGDYLQAEMVKAFLTSLEYRARFGP
jgi:hypothetical protein